MNQSAVAIERTRSSRLSEIDFDHLAFGRTFSDHMLICDYVDGQWGQANILPYGPIELGPANMALHYGQAVFEGMKATKHTDGRAMLFRPELHSQRLNRSAARLAMPELPEERFLDFVHAIVDLDRGWIPPGEGSALYVRPFMFALDSFVGVRPSDTYRFMIITCPVGPYYAKPVRLFAETHYVRAVAGGVGEAKAAGNYAAAMLPSRQAQAKGYDQVLWLDAHRHELIQEVGTMNIFFVIDGRVITPATQGAILRGITRRTLIELMRAEGYDVEERPIGIHEIREAHRAGKLQEAFGSGTAAVVSQVATIHYDGEDMELPPVEQRRIGPTLKRQIDGIRSGRLPSPEGWLIEAGARVESALV